MKLKKYAFLILGLQPREKEAMLGDKTQKKFRFVLVPNMAVMTSAANQQ